MAETILDKFTAALDKFSSSVTKDLAEVRKERNAVQQMKSEIFNAQQKAKYIRDDNTLILSAPNIIIGNVDVNGRLLGDGGGSVVVLRGNNVSLEATGTPEFGGNIVSRAASIRNIAVDPGDEGQDNVVCKLRSEIVNQANSITLASSEDEGAFVTEQGLSSPGVSILSETFVNIKATPSVEGKSKLIKDETKSLESQIKTLNTKVGKSKTSIKNIAKEVSKLVEKQEDFFVDEQTITTDYQDMMLLQEQFASLRSQLDTMVAEYISDLSLLAELNYRKKSLEAISKKLDGKKNAFKTGSTKSRVAIQAERFDMTSIDGDGTLRSNPEASLNIHVPHVSITADDAKGTTMKDSHVNISTKDFTLATVKAELDEKREKGTVKADGSVTIITKDVSLQAVDMKKDGKDKFEETALTAGGKLSVRMQDVVVSSTDTEGKPTGKFDVNAKSVRIAATDVDKKTRAAKDPAQGTDLTLIAEKMTFGDKEKKKTKSIDVTSSETLTAKVEKTIEIDQGGKAKAKFDGGKINAEASEVSVKGETKVDGNVKVSKDVSATNGNFSAKVSTKSFKSNNIMDN